MTSPFDSCQVSVHHNPYAGAYGFKNEAFTAEQLSKVFTREEWEYETRSVRSEARNMQQEAMQYETRFFTG